ncbi:MAG: DUF4397 domain-containing protein [Siphonobacter aquaeclarae]|nr:DUF4397 domain-containing protein [Siphonobacter aquaeclarae]
MNTFVKSILTAATMLVVAACGSEHDPLTSLAPQSGARIKFYHAAPDAAGVNLYVNDKLFSGVNTVPANPQPLPTPVTYFTSYPVLDYAVVGAGAAKFSVKLAATASAAESALLSGDATVEDGKYYSVFTIGTTGGYELLTVADNLPGTDKSKAYVRVVNLVKDSPAGGYELLVNGKSVTTAAAYKSASAFVAVDPVAYGATAQTVVAKNGATSLTATGGIQPYAGRYYTVVVRGVFGNTKTPPTATLSVNL